jgi:prepilin-type N-terminal cleavage/methylation domain-containing protein
MKRNQSGFTLIEIAIVLVIIGLLLGGVMKGQELINSARVKNLATDFKNIPVYVYGYQDKFRALPGDDPAVHDHLGSSAVQATSGVGSANPGNGTIDGAWDATAGGGAETQLFWQHVRMAGLAPGPTDDSKELRPANAVGGYVGVTNAKDAPITNMRGSFIVCSGGIPGKFAKQLDITMDDGKTDTGSMQTKSASANTAEASPVDDTTYVVCMGY